MEPLIIFGGSFDPIHNGHIRLANKAGLILGGEVIFLPSASPRWKKVEAASKDRLEMVKLALKYDGSPRFSLSTYEMDKKEETNYTIDSINYFSKKYPNRPLYLLVGADTLSRLKEWKNIDEILSKYKIVYVPRPGIDENEEIARQLGLIRLDYAGSGEVSSTSIRNLSSQDICPPVREYIEKNRLYYFKDLERYMSPHRLSHSVQVANLAYKIALKNKIERPERAYIAGLLHDVGKDLSEQRQREIMGKSYPNYLSFPLWTYHQFVGAAIAKEDFHIEDEGIISAIAYHATGGPHLSPLGKIIYSADKIEPSRGYDSSMMINACLKSYYVGFLTVLEENRRFLMSKGYKVDNPLTRECFNLYLEEDNDLCTI